MSTAMLQHVKGETMEKIDVHDLPEEQVQLVAAFVEFLRGWQRTDHDSTEQEHDWQRASLASFAKDWDNDQDAIYDNWQEHYHVPQR
jgi:hypothetical protein